MAASFNRQEGMGSYLGQITHISGRDLMISPEDMKKDEKDTLENTEIYLHGCHR